MSRRLRSGASHLLMRAGLGFVLGWFGVQELHSPSEWAIFVPSFVSDYSPISVNDLIFLHGFLLLLAAASIVLGLFLVLGCFLALGLLVEIVVGLLIDGGASDLVIRDVGLLALAGALGLDRARVWRLDAIMPGRFRTHAGPKEGRGQASETSWPVRAGYAAS